MGAPPGGGFQVNVFLRDRRHRVPDVQHPGAWHRAAQPHASPSIDLLPYGRQEEWQDSPEGWPQSPTYSRWAPSEAFARYAERADRVPWTPACGATLSEASYCVPHQT